MSQIQDQDEQPEQVMTVEEIDLQVQEKLKELQELVKIQGLKGSASMLQQQKGKQQLHKNSPDKCNSNANSNKAQQPRLGSVNSTSEETIYDKILQKRNSSSSKEADTSDELLQIQFDNMQVIHDLATISDGRTGRHECDMEWRSIVAGPSGIQVQSRPRELTPEEKATQKIKDAEAAKAMMFLIKGKRNSQSFCQTALIDKSYMVVRGHLDSSMLAKIRDGEYVDFAKLIPKDRVLAEEDKHLQMIMKNGRAYYVPVNDGTNISNFHKWEQAFRVYSNVYTKFHPDRSSELIEYNHVIHTISQTYIWDNVYMYDKDFRIHLSHNPQRNWSVILQQAWSLRLKDKITGSQGTNHSRNSSGNVGSPGTSDQGRIGEPCRHYNKGKCPFDADCHYEHRCSYCFKFGHSVIYCRKLQADQEWGRSNSKGKHRYSKPNASNWHGRSSEPG